MISGSGLKDSDKLKSLLAYQESADNKNIDNGQINDVIKDGDHKHSLKRSVSKEYLDQFGGVEDSLQLIGSNIENERTQEEGLYMEAPSSKILMSSLPTIQ